MQAPRTRGPLFHPKTWALLLFPLFLLSLHSSALLVRACRRHHLVLPVLLLRAATKLARSSLAVGHGRMELPAANWSSNDVDCRRALGSQAGASSSPPAMAANPWSSSRHGRLKLIKIWSRTRGIGVASPVRKRAEAAGLHA